MSLCSRFAVVVFGSVGYFIFVFGFGSNINDFGGPGELTDPFQKELLPGVPMVAAGFALFVVGGVLAGIGGGISKAARKREEELRQRQRWQRRGPDGGGKLALRQRAGAGAEPRSGPVTDRT